MLAYVTSSVTSVMTTLALDSRIHSFEDLPGKSVGVAKGSIAEQIARQAGLDVVTFPHFREVVQALAEQRIAAIVDDAPVLEYYAFTNPRQPLSVVGAIFEPDKYGFGLPIGSPLTRPITIELIGIHESGLLEELRTRYFGANQ